LSTLALLASQIEAEEVLDEEGWPISDDEAQRLMFEKQVELSIAAPADFQQFIERLDQGHIEEAEEYDYDIASTAELRGQQAKRAVGEYRLAVANQEIDNIMRGAQERSAAKLTDAVAALVDVDDPESVNRYLHLKGWLSESGHDLEALAEQGKGDEAARLLHSAYAQDDAFAREAQDEEIKSRIMAAPSVSVSEGLAESERNVALESKLDGLAENLEHQNVLKKLEMGLSLPSAQGREFDANYTPPPEPTEDRTGFQEIKLARDADGNVLRNEDGHPVAEPGWLDEAADHRNVTLEYTDDEGAPVTEDEAVRLSSEAHTLGE
jgi:hypothetical protein